MAQQINLLDPALMPRPDALSAVRGLMAAGAVLLLSGVAAAALQWAAAADAGKASVSQQQLAAQRAKAGSIADTQALQAQIAQLRAMEASQRRVRSQIDDGPAGRGEGYAAFFAALSRQAHPALWITGFAVSADGHGLELSGRMLDSAALPDYLRHLNAEPLFKGRPFAALDLKAVDPSPGATPAAAPYTEFALRSQPTEARR